MLAYEKKHGRLANERFKRSYPAAVAVGLTLAAALHFLLLNSMGAS